MNAAEINSIVDRVLRGEIDAYETIVRAYQREVWKVVTAMLFDARGAEDLVQRSFAERLPPSSAKVLELRYVLGRNFGEIAALIGRTVEASRQHLARIRLSLRECIEKHLARL
jgi:DNA-directed RNA polymerase specialized sigma24 family protein